MAASNVVLLLALAGTVGILPIQQVEGQEPDGDAPTLYVSYYDRARLDAAVREAMALEVERVFGAIGLRVREVSADDLARGVLPEGRMPMRVLVLARSPMDWDLKPGTLGVMMGDEPPATAVYAFAPTIRRALGISNRPAGYLTVEEIGRAYARVVIHEIVHAFAPDHPHRGSGIMGHEQDAGSLIQAGLEIDVGSAEAFLEAWERIESAGQRNRRSPSGPLVGVGSGSRSRCVLTRQDREVVCRPSRSARRSTRKSTSSLPTLLH